MDNKRITKIVNAWLVKNGFETKVRFGNTFQYNPDTNTIMYSNTPYRYIDTLFNRCAKAYNPAVNDIDTFILGLFHELGHHETENDFNAKQWREYGRFAADLAKKDRLTICDHLLYFRHPLEWAATTWACDYIANNHENVKDLQKKLRPLVK